MKRKVSSSGIIYYENSIESNHIILLVGGLGNMADGFYANDLFHFGDRIGYKTISIQLHSMPDYGLYTIDSDVEDVVQIYRDLSIDSYKSVVFIGHSTGCQILMLYSMHKKQKDTEIIILQAPVSDREYEEHTNPKLDETLSLAEDLNKIMKQRNAINPTKREGNTVIYLKYKGAPIRADRFLSLFKEGEKEDFFSIGQKICHLNASNTRIYAILSKFDEYQAVPIEKTVEHIKAIPNMQKIYLVDALHGLNTGQDNNSSGLNKFYSILKEIINAHHKRCGLSLHI